eukprot:jgi/Botrbrau1/20122/Bobra.0173s0024.2
MVKEAMGSSELKESLSFFCQELVASLASQTSGRLVCLASHVLPGVGFISISTVHGEDLVVLGATLRKNGRFVRALHPKKETAAWRTIESNVVCVSAYKPDQRNYADVTEATEVCGCTKLVCIPIPVTKADKYSNKNETTATTGNSLSPNPLPVTPYGVLVLGVDVAAPEIKR